MKIMDAKEFLENKGWSKDSPTVGGAFWMGMVEILEEYYQHKIKAENLPISDVSASTVKSLHTALTNLLQATDDEGWNNEGEDWEEQLEARRVLAQTPKEYLC